jgi:hypothetical protein
MMIHQLKIFFYSLVIFILLSACTNLSTDPSTNESSDTKLEIFSPNSNDLIGVGVTEIDYLISTPASLKFMELYVNGSFNGNFAPKTDGSQPKIYLSLSEALIGTSINYHLIYYDINETSLKSEEILNVNVVVTVNPPFAPYNLSIINLTQSSINLSWKDSSLKVESYEIWRKINFDGLFQKYINVEGNIYNINDENLDPNKMYTYKLRGFNEYGESLFSEEVNNFGVGSSGNLYPPTNLTAIVNGSRLVRLSWMDNSLNENLFAIERRKVNDEFVKIGITNRNITQFADSVNGLEPGGEYYYRVKSYSNSDSAWSNVIFVQTQWYDIIRPTNLQAIYLGDGKVVLAWTDDDYTNTLIEIERKKNNDLQFVTIERITGDQNTFLDENLSLMQSYTYRIRSGDGVYYSDYSNEVTVTTGVSKP